MKAAIALAVALVPMAALTSQTVTGRTVIAAPKSSVRIPGVAERLDGVWAGLALDMSLGRFSISAAGTRGSVTPVDAEGALKRDVGEIVLRGRYDVRNALGLELRYAARAFSSPAGYQRWDIVGVGPTIARDLGTPTMQAVATLAYLPVVNLSGHGQPSFAMSSEVGLIAAPRGLPLTVLMNYRVERFSFSRLGRVDQFETLSLSVGLRRRIGGTGE